MTSPRVASVAQETSMIVPCQKFEGHAGVIYGAIHLPGGQRMMTCSADGSLRVWDLKSGEQIGDEWRDGKSGVWRISLSPDGKKVVSGGEDGALRLWDIDTGKVIAKWLGHTKRLWSVCWSRDGQQVLSGSYDGTAREWDVEKGETILGPIKTGHEYMYAAVYSPDMAMFATGGKQPWDSSDNKSQVKIWDTKTGKLVATLEGHTESVLCLAWTPDGKTHISGATDHSIRTWSTTTWKQTAVLNGHSYPVFDIAMSPNGRILASASLDQTARLWNLDNNRPISSPLQHADSVHSVSFSADGKLLATGCNDRNAYTWDISAIVKEAGLEELLLEQCDNANATRRPVCQPITASNRVPQGFFDCTPHRYRAHSSARLDLRDTPSRPRIFHWVRNLFSDRSNDAEIKLHERGSVVVDVPSAKGKRRNASAREKRMVIIPLKSKNPVASTSHPPNSNAIQSSGVAQPQPSPQLQAALSTTSITPPAVANEPSTNPHIIIKHAGRWTRFWVSICCASSEYTDGHH